MRASRCSRWKMLRLPMFPNGSGLVSGRCSEKNAIAEGQALAARAPIDLRVNTLKSEREKLLKRLAHVGAVACPLSPVGMRIAPKPGAARMPHVQAEEGYRKGWFELQDEASQLVSLLAGPEPGMQVLDYCAGGGGKTLALAARMENRGQIYAYDADRLRLAPIHERFAAGRRSKCSGSRPQKRGA